MNFNFYILENIWDTKPNPPHRPHPLSQHIRHIGVERHPLSRRTIFSFSCSEQGTRWRHCPSALAAAYTPRASAPLREIVSHKATKTQSDRWETPCCSFTASSMRGRECRCPSLWLCGFVRVLVSGGVTRGDAIRRVHPSTTLRAVALPVPGRVLAFAAPIPRRYTPPHDRHHL